MLCATRRPEFGILNVWNRHGRAGRGKSGTWNEQGEVPRIVVEALAIEVVRHNTARDVCKSSAVLVWIPASPCVLRLRMSQANDGDHSILRHRAKR